MKPRRRPEKRKRPWTTTARFPDDSGVEVRYPLTQEQYDGDRDEWSWLRGTITQQCGPDEWQVCVEDIRVATRKDGSKPTARTPHRNL